MKEARLFGGSALQVGGTGSAKALGQDPACCRNSQEAPEAGAELRTEGGGEGGRGLGRSAGPPGPDGRTWTFTLGEVGAPRAVSRGGVGPDSGAHRRPLATAAGTWR